jgi:outer membrane autotransporter protein
MRRLAVTDGTLELAGSYAMEGDSAFRTVIHGDGRHGRLSVDGACALDGALTVTKGTGLFVNGTTYDIITASAMEDAFASVTLPELKPLVRFTLQQLPDRVRIGPRTLPFVTMASDPVQMALADYLDRIAPMASGELRDLLARIQNLDAAPLDQAYSRLSPAPFDLFTQASYHGAHLTMEALQRRMSLTRFHAQAEGQASAAEPILLAMAGSGDVGPLLAAGGVPERQGKNGLWVSGLSQWGDQEADDGFPGYDFRLHGGTLGFDHTWASNLTLGVSVGLGSTHVDLHEGAGDGGIDTHYGSLYGSWFTANAYVEGAVSYGRNGYDVDREVIVGADRRTAASDHDGDVYAAFLGGGWVFDRGAWAWGPEAALRYVYLDEEAFRETGAGSANLTVDDRQTDSLVAELGLRAAGLFQTSRGRLMPELRAALSYDVGIDDRVITASFEGAPNVAFSTDGQDVEPLGVVVGGGLTWLTEHGFLAELKYAGEFREKYQSHGVMAQIRISF